LNYSLSKDGDHLLEATNPKEAWNPGDTPNPEDSRTGSPEDPEERSDKAVETGSGRLGAKGREGRKT